MTIKLRLRTVNPKSIRGIKNTASPRISSSALISKSILEWGLIGRRRVIGEEARLIPILIGKAMIKRIVIPNDFTTND